MLEPIVGDSFSSIPDAVPRGVVCVGCGYDLRGLDRGGRCPECGREVAFSLGLYGLDRTDPRVLQRVKCGCGLITWWPLVSLVTVGTCGCLTGTLVMREPAAWPVTYVYGMSAYAAWLTGPVGLWLVGTRTLPPGVEPVSAGSGDTVRWVLRGSAAVTAAGPLGVAGLGQEGVMYGLAVATVAPCVAAALVAWRTWALRKLDTADPPGIVGGLVAGSAVATLSVCTAVAAGAFSLVVPASVLLLLTWVGLSTCATSLGDAVAKAQSRRLYHEWIVGLSQRRHHRRPDKGL